MLGACRQLLADVAALLEIDAVERLEAALHQRRPADLHVAAAVGCAVGDAVALVIGGVALGEARLLQEREVRVARQDRAKPERRAPGIAHYPATFAGRRAAFAGRHAERTVNALAAEERHHPKILGRVGKLDVGAQSVRHQPPPEVADARPLAVEQIAVPPPQHEEIVKELALGREQRRVDAARVGHTVDIVGYQPLEEGAGLGPVHGDHAAVVERDVERGAHRQSSGFPQSAATGAYYRHRSRRSKRCAGFARRLRGRAARSGPERATARRAEWRVAKRAE